MDHLSLPEKLAGRIQMQYYNAGHMMYLHDEDLARLKANIARFGGKEGSGKVVDPVLDLHLQVRIRHQRLHEVPLDVRLEIHVTPLKKFFQSKGRSQKWQTERKPSRSREEHGKPQRT
jgi:hypothetical protein